MSEIPAAERVRRVSYGSDGNIRSTSTAMGKVIAAAAAKAAADGRETIKLR